MYLSIISGQAFNLSMFERSQNWNAKTEIFQTLGGGTEFQNARTSHRRIRFSSAMETLKNEYIKEYNKREDHDDFIT